MVIQAFEGWSDRESIEHFTFDARVRYAAGVDFAFQPFGATRLCEMRARLRLSKAPNRIHDAVLSLAKQWKLLGKRRVVDSTAIYDAVTTQDTVTLVYGGIRRVLQASSEALRVLFLAKTMREDRYEPAGKPRCDWDDAAAREALVDSLTRDALAIVSYGTTLLKLETAVKEALELLATLVGQDIEKTEDDRFRIARKVAKNRVISVVDSDARHGHKTKARHFDGYKGHIAIDPDSEIITATEVTAGNVSDAEPAKKLLADVLPKEEKTHVSSDELANVRGEDTFQPLAEPGVEVYGDASYGTAGLVEAMEKAGIEANVKVQPPSSLHGHFSLSEFDIDLSKNTVKCPGGQLITLRKRRDERSYAQFGDHCTNCPLRARCTDSPQGRTVSLHPKHEMLERARRRQQNPAWKSKYRSIRPKVERKISHLMRRKHGGRHARVRGTARVALDFATRAAALNLVRIARLLER